MKLTDFGKEVRKIRIDRNQLLKDMAAELEISSAFLSALETGRKQVPPGFVDRLALAYDLDEETVGRLHAIVSKSRTDFAIRLTKHATQDQREAAAVLARRFPGLNDQTVQKIMNAIRDDKEDK
jgi:transcriptional regulator with XRE-family HTH domain